MSDEDKNEVELTAEEVLQNQNDQLSEQNKSLMATMAIQKQSVAVLRVQGINRQKFIESIAGASRFSVAKKFRVAAKELLGKLPK